MVDSRYPMWTGTEKPDSPKVINMRTDRREILLTSVLEAEPESRQILPGPSIWPFLLAIAVAFTFAGAMLHIILPVIGFFLCAFAIAGWLWPGNLNTGKEASA
jgi:cytochrome c oxidase subunit 1